MSDETKEMFQFFGAWVAGIAVVGIGLLACVGVPSFYSERYECGQAHVNTGAETKFVKNHIMSWDCYVKVDGKWIPIDKWRGDES